MRIVQEEIFGPVQVILPYDYEKALIDAVNAADYGLAAYVQSGSLERARKVASQIRAGSVYINSAIRRLPAVRQRSRMRRTRPE